VQNVRSGLPERPGIVSPLTTWFPDEGAVKRFRTRWLSRAPVSLAPRDTAWRRIAPGAAEAIQLARSGVPFQIAIDRRYDRSGDPGHLPRALAAGATVFLPQVHQVLPRLARLMVALRHAFCGPFREECSFLFVVDGAGRSAMGLHHDGAVDSFWLQLEGRRSVTLGPRVRPGTPTDLDDRPAGGRPGPGWSTTELGPGTLTHLPPWTPHRVMCHGRSLAATLTWGPRHPGAAAPSSRPSRRPSGRTVESLTAWDVVSGYADDLPRPSRDRVFVQVPAIAGPRDSAGRVALWTAGGDVRPRLDAHRFLAHLPRMPTLRRRTAGSLLEPLLAAGILGSRDLPLRIVPDEPAALDGWQFA
jgi:hypothetical protein